MSETIGLRMAEDPVFLAAGTLRTAVDGALMVVPPSEPAHMVVAFWDSPLSHGINVFVGLVRMLVSMMFSFQICSVKERDPAEMRDLPSRYVEIGEITEL